MEKLPIALQLYSLRDLANENFVKTLELAADLGYEGVEFAGYFGLTPEELRGHLDRLGLVPVSSHVSYQRLTQDLTEEIEFNLAIGNHTLVCPAPPKELAQDAAGWQELAKQLTEVGKQLQERGMRLCYHNHSFEFEKYNGVYALDILYEAADPRYVLAQIDLGWVLHGGEDPVEYLRQFKGRCPLVHVKDFDEANDQTDVGLGVLDLPKVLTAADEVGVEWLILETEVYAVSPEHSVEVGLNNIRKAQER